MYAVLAVLGEPKLIDFGCSSNKRASFETLCQGCWRLLAHCEDTIFRFPLNRFYIFATSLRMHSFPSGVVPVSNLFLFCDSFTPSATVHLNKAYQIVRRSERSLLLLCVAHPFF